MVVEVISTVDDDRSRVVSVVETCSVGDTEVLVSTLVVVDSTDVLLDALVELDASVVEVASEHDGPLQGTVGTSFLVDCVTLSVVGLGGISVVDSETVSVVKVDSLVAGRVVNVLSLLGVGVDVVTLHEFPLQGTV